MLIPSICLMGGKIVQPIHGQKKALEFENFEYWVERFLPFSMVQLVDLDAALGSGSNHALIEYFAQRLPCQVGGGLRSVEAIQRTFLAGAKKVIIGSALFRHGDLDLKTARAFAHAAAAARLIFAVDSRAGRVWIKGWTQATQLTPQHVMRETAEFCGAHLFTHIDTAGTMSGIPLEIVESLKAGTQRRLIVAGGIRSMHEVQILDTMGVDAVVGTALYTGALGEASFTPRNP